MALRELQKFLLNDVYSIFVEEFLIPIKHSKWYRCLQNTYISLCMSHYIGHIQIMGDNRQRKKLLGKCVACM